MRLKPLQVWGVSRQSIRSQALGFSPLWSGSSFRAVLWVCLPACTERVCACACVCSLQVYRLYIWGLCCVRMEREGVISEDISVPCLQMWTFYLVNFMVFFMYCVFISFLWYEVLVPAVAGFIRLSSQPWKPFLLGFFLAISSFVLRLSTIGCLHVCLAPIGQTKI